MSWNKFYFNNPKGERMKNIYGLVLAGGVGSRLWPLSTQDKPKQFVDVLGDGESLIQKTNNRLNSFIKQDHIFYLTNTNYKTEIINQLHLNNDFSMFEEPCMRNTAPALALASYKIMKMNPEAILLICPSDQLIKNEDAFKNAASIAFNHLKDNDSIITFGIEPDSPNTGYGYINYSKDTNGEVKSVIRFTEKPDLEKAKTFIQSGDYLWNAGIFAWKAKYFVELVRKYMPETAKKLDENLDKLNTKEEIEFLEKEYQNFESISVDFAILEKEDNVKVIPVDMNWDDLGSYSAIGNHAQSSEHGNIGIGLKNLVESNSKNNFVFLDQPEDVVLHEVEDIAVVRANGKLIITTKDKLVELKSVAKSNHLI